MSAPMPQPGRAYPPQQPAFPASWPMLRRKPQAVVIPIIAIVLGSLIGGLITLLTFGGAAMEGHAFSAVMGIIFSAVVASLGVLYLNWLDRWEPEPPLLLVTAFFWGGGVALLITEIVNAIFATKNEFLVVAVRAPLVEESAKGAFFLLVMLTTRKARNELNSLTDALVYAGMIGIGFSFVEDLTYIARANSLGDATMTLFMRGIGAFSHSIYTSLTAIGIWKGLNSRGALRVLWPMLGWLGAVTLHGIHNGSGFVLGNALVTIAFVLLFDFACFVGFLVLAWWSRRLEKRTVAQQLHPMVRRGWVTPQEADWLASLTQRRGRLKMPALPADEKKRLRSFSDDATELAFVRSRLDAQVARGERPSPELIAHHDELVALLQDSRAFVAARVPQTAPHQWHAPVAPHLPPQGAYAGPPQGWVPPQGQRPQPWLPPQPMGVAPGPIGPQQRRF